MTCTTHFILAGNRFVFFRIFECSPIVLDVNPKANLFVNALQKPKSVFICNIFWLRSAIFYTFLSFSLALSSGISSNSKLPQHELFLTFLLPRTGAILSSLSITLSSGISSNSKLPQHELFLVPLFHCKRSVILQRFINPFFSFPFSIMLFLLSMSVWWVC